MAEIEEIIKAHELSFMQAWMHRDIGALKRRAARHCMMIVGSNPPELLDRPSFVAAVEKDFRCTGFRLSGSLVRHYGRTAWHTAGAELELRLGAKDWSGRFLMTGLWRKHRLGGWKLTERSISPLASDETLAASLRRMQLWH